MKLCLGRLLKGALKGDSEPVPTSDLDVALERLKGDSLKDDLLKGGSGALGDDLKYMRLQIPYQSDLESAHFAAVLRVSLGENYVSYWLLNPSHPSLDSTRSLFLLIWIVMELLQELALEEQPNLEVWCTCLAPFGAVVLVIDEVRNLQDWRKAPLWLLDVELEIVRRTVLESVTSGSSALELEPYPDRVYLFEAHPYWACFANS